MFTLIAVFKTLLLCRAWLPVFNCAAIVYPRGAVIFIRFIFLTLVFFSMEEQRSTKTRLTCERLPIDKSIRINCISPKTITLKGVEFGWWLKSLRVHHTKPKNPIFRWKRWHPTSTFIAISFYFCLLNSLMFVFVSVCFNIYLSLLAFLSYDK